MNQRSEAIRNLSYSDINRITEKQAREENGGFMNLRRKREIQKQLEEQKRNERFENSFEKKQRIREEAKRQFEQRRNF